MAECSSSSVCAQVFKPELVATPALVANNVLLLHLEAICSKNVDRLFVPRFCSRFSRTLRNKTNCLLIFHPLSVCSKFPLSYFIQGHVFTNQYRTRKCFGFFKWLRTLQFIALSNFNCSSILVNSDLLLGNTWHFKYLFPLDHGSLSSNVIESWHWFGARKASLYMLLGAIACLWSYSS